MQAKIPPLADLIGFSPPNHHEAGIKTMLIEVSYFLHVLYILIPKVYLAKAHIYLLTGVLHSTPPTHCVMHVDHSFIEGIGCISLG